jgi:Kef-type K+ transport system membrane component KefB
MKYAPDDIPFYAFSLFMGIAMSITAFPVLAHIIREKGLSNTKLGNLAMSCAVLSDVICWCLLAVILSFVKVGSTMAALLNLLMGFLFAGVMFMVIRPLLKNLLIAKSKNGITDRSVLAISLVILMISTYCSVILDMHALFGAFIAGVIIPREGNFVKRLISKIEDFTFVFLLPVFFVYTGLQIHIVFLSNTAFWITCLLIIIVAIAGKYGGSALASRLAGESVKDSLSLGALLNTRGLMELVVLNIGYELGLISLQLFTMMILMALITTMMTGPIFNLINKVNIRNQGE